MSIGARIALAIVGLCFSFFFALMAPGHGLIGWLPTVFCSTLSLSCLPGKLGRVSLRVLGASIFAICLWYLVSEVASGNFSSESQGSANIPNAIVAFLTFGLPFGYLACFGLYPPWALFQNRPNMTTTKAGNNTPANEIENETTDALLKNEKLIEGLEQQAKQDPHAYQWQVAWLAILGYAYIVGMVALLLIIVVITFFLLIRFPNFILVKLVLVPVVAIYLIAKSLIVKFEPPKGVPIKYSDAPALFNLIREVSVATGGPTVHAVILVSEFNCSIRQVPRLGVFGFHKNYLSIGLPLMQGMPLEHFKAVLAHEMGHLSNRHGKFACWIYHLQTSWLQLSQNLNRTSAHGLFSTFANWFFPLFDAHTLVLRRNHEYAADQIAGALVGPQVLAQALIKTAVVSLYTEDTFWPEQEKLVRDLPEPPQGVLRTLHQSVNKGLTGEQASALLTMVADNHQSDDSHPTLLERIKALSQKADNSDLIAVFLATETSFSQQKSAAQVLLGDSLVIFQERVEELWRKEIFPHWKAQHQELQKVQQRLARLEERATSGKLCKEELVERAQYTATLGETDKAIDLFRTLLANDSANAEFHYYLGSLLLSNHNEEGIKYLKQSLELGRVRGHACCLELYQHLLRVGQKHEAQAYRKRAKEYLHHSIRAVRENIYLTLTDKFTEHTLSHERLQNIRSILYADARIRQAWLVNRQMPEILGGIQPVLVVQLGSPSWLPVGNEELLKAIPQLAQVHELESFYITTWEGIKNNLGTACKTLPSASIYDRKEWEKSEDCNRFVYTPTAETINHPPRSFIAENKVSIIGLCLLIGFILCGIFFTGHQQPKNDLDYYKRQSSSGSDVHDNIDFGPYMSELQSTIKSHWFPPKLKVSKLVVVRFKIYRDGHISNLQIFKSSADADMDQAAIDAVNRANPFAPLPAGAPDSVDIEFTLDYNAHHGFYLTH